MRKNSRIYRFSKYRQIKIKLYNILYKVFSLHFVKLMVAINVRESLLEIVSKTDTLQTL